MTFYTGSVVGTGIQAQIDSVMSTAGWTKTGASYPFTYSNSSASGQDRLVSFTIDAVAAAAITCSAIGTSNKTLYIYTGATSLSGTFILTMSVGPNHVFICLEGPAPAGTGAKDATWGSTRSFFGMFPLVPYYLSDNVVADQVVAMSGTSASSDTGTEKCYVKKGLNAAAWEPAELMTMRQAVINPGVVGSLINKRETGGSNVIYWPFVVSEDNSGVRGRLAEVYLGGEAYLDTGDGFGQSHSGLSPNIDGIAFTTVSPFFIPNGGSSVNYSPFGVPIKNLAQTSGAVDGGPFIVVRS